MSRVNFVSEFNGFMRYARDRCMPIRERMLWIALFYIANDRAIFDEETREYDWPDGYMSIANAELSLYCSLDKRGIETLRKDLQARGLIDYIPGEKNRRNPGYRMRYLSLDAGFKLVPNDAPEPVARDNYVPAMPDVGSKNAPNLAPITRDDGYNAGSENVPNLAPMTGGDGYNVGYKNAPIYINNNKSNINQNSNRAEAGGLVDLDSIPEGNGGLLPL